MKRARTALIASATAALLAVGVAGSAASAAKAPKLTTVAKDVAGDWGANVDPTLAPVGDALGQDLVSASIGGDKKTVTFQIGVNSLPPSGGVPEITRYVWSLQVDGNYVELDGKFTNYSRGACDPTAGSCPPPRDPGLYPFLVRGNCTSVEGQNVTTCEELGIVSATFDAASGTITIPVPAALIKAKPGSKITTGSSQFTSTAGGPIVAVPAAFVSNTASPMDTMTMTGTFTVPTK